jgi:hypothetical protein
MRWVHVSLQNSIESSTSISSHSVLRLHQGPFVTDLPESSRTRNFVTVNFSLPLGLASLDTPKGAELP